jgi:hypothetical protein
VHIPATQSAGPSKADNAVTGYASIFNSEDLGGDIVIPGAIARSLREHGPLLIRFQYRLDDARRSLRGE